MSIGLGMISRGEVALIVAQKGAQAGLVSEKMFPAIVLMVIVTTLVTPLLLKVGILYWAIMPCGWPSFSTFCYEV